MVTREICTLMKNSWVPPGPQSIIRLKLLIAYLSKCTKIYRFEGQIKNKILVAKLQTPILGRGLGAPPGCSHSRLTTPTIKPMASPSSGLVPGGCTSRLMIRVSIVRHGPLNWGARRGLPPPSNTSGGHPYYWPLLENAKSASSLAADLGHD